MGKGKKYIPILIMAVLAAGSMFSITVSAEDVQKHFNGNRYQVFNLGGYTWQEAEKYCEELGGHLVTITSSEEQEFVTGLLVEDKEFYWIGSRQSEVTGQWFWVTGEDFNYENWAPGQPDNDGRSESESREDYAGITGRNTYYAGIYEWNDFCNDGGNSGLWDNGFICEWDSKEGMTQVDCSKITVEVADYDSLGYTKIAGAHVDVEGVGEAITDAEGTVDITNSITGPSAMKRITVKKEGYRDYIFYTTIVSPKMISLFSTNQFYSALKKKREGDDTVPYVSTVVYYQDEKAKTCGGQYFERSDTVTFRVCGVWNDKKPGYYRMYQVGGKSFESNNGIFRLNIGESFTGSGVIYVKMIAENGTESEPERVYISVPKGNSLSVDDSYVSILNENCESGWQTDVPFLNNDKLSFDLGKLKTTIKRDGSKVRIMLGAETSGGNLFKDEEWEEWKKFCESQPTDLSLSQWKNVLLSDNMTTSWTVGIKIKATGYGWLENDMAADSKTPLTGGIQVVIDMSTSYKQQYAVGVIPIYMEESMGIKGELGGSVTFDTNNRKFGGSTELKVTPSFSVGGGVGVLYVATVGAEGNASMPMIIDFPKGVTQADLKGSLSLKASVLGFSYSKKMVEATYSIYKEDETKSARTRNVLKEQKNAVSFYNMDDYALPEEAVPETKWYGERMTRVKASSDTKTNLMEKLLQTGTSDLTEPMLIQEGNVTLAVFLTEDSSRNMINRTKLVYTVYDENSGEWSSPRAVDEDGTGDFQPYLAASNGRIAVSWLNYSDTVSDSFSMKEALQCSSICYAVWDKNAKSFVKSDKQLFSSSTVSYNSARICIDAEGNVTEIGLKNTTADIFGVSGDNVLFFRGNYGGETVGREFVLSQGIPVSYDVTEWRDTVTAAVCIDTDKNLTTLSDREIYLFSSNGEIKRVTNNSTYDSVPQFAGYQEGDALFWYAENGYQVLDNTGKQYTILEEDSIGISENFTVINGDKNETALVWSSVDENKIYQLTACILDIASGKWSRKVVLTNSEENIFRPSGYFNRDGNMEFLYRKGNMVGEGSLYALQAVQAPDVQVVNAYIKDGTEVPGKKTTVFVGVRNLGTKKITRYSIDVDGQTTDGLTNLFPGESIVLEAEYTVPIEVQNKTIAIQIAVDGDSDISNNIFELTTGYADISVAAAEDEWENGKIVHVSVENNEAVSANSVLEVHKDSIDGELVSTLELGMLKQGDLVTIDFVYQRGKNGYDVDANALYYVVTSSAMEKYESNNYDYSIFHEKDIDNASTPTETEPEQTPPNFQNMKMKVGQIVKQGILKYKVSKVNGDGTGEVILIGSDRKKTDKKFTSLKIRNSITIGEKPFKIVAVGKGAFSGYKKLKTIVIGKNVTSINDKAFYKCTVLTKITISAGVRKIGKQVFYGCKKLKNITIKTQKLIPKNVGSKAFKGIYAKAVIKVPKNKQKAYKQMLKTKGVSQNADIKK